MNNEKIKPYLTWLFYYLLLILLYTLQTTPNLFLLFGVKPILIIPLVVSVSMMENIMPSVIFSTIAGLLWDISSDKLFGFNGSIFLLLSTIIALLCIYYLRVRLINCIVFSFLFCVCALFMEYVFYFAIWDIESTEIVLNNMIFTTIYTTIISPIVYLIIKTFFVKFVKKE